MPLLLILSCRVQHIFDENTVTGVRGVHKNMGYGSHQLAVLNNGTAAHADVK